MRYLITGTPGSGKSTIGKLLQKEGYGFVDSDHAQDLANWHNKETGKIVQSHSGEDIQWYEQHSWDWDREKLKQLLHSYGEQDFFFVVSHPTKQKI